MVFVDGTFGAALPQDDGAGALTVFVNFTFGAALPQDDGGGPGPVSRPLLRPVL